MSGPGPEDDRYTGHDWVTYLDTPGKVVWCHGCGQHRVEMTPAEQAGPCPAYLKALQGEGDPLG